MSGYELMRHALGVQRRGERWQKPYRNYFCAGEKDVAAWRELVADGYATCFCAGNKQPYDGPSFSVTDKGREAALAGLEFKRAWGYGKPVNL